MLNYFDRKKRSKANKNTSPGSAYIFAPEIAIEPEPLLFF